MKKEDDYYTGEYASKDVQERAERFTKELRDNMQKILIR